MGNSRRIAQPCTVMYIVRYAIMLSAVLGLKLDSKDGKESEFVNYGRRASPSPGEMRVATLSIKGVSSQAYSNSFPQQPIYLSVLKPPGGYGSNHESFNFFLRDFEDAVIGQGHKVGFSLQFSGIDSRGKYTDQYGNTRSGVVSAGIWDSNRRGSLKQILGPQLEYEGHEVKKINMCSDIADMNDADKICDKEVLESVYFWMRQEKKYLPGCSLMLDRAAEPWRMSGICDGVVSVEFDVEPHTDFWE